MIGWAISSSTSGGTETGPGVKRYLFVGITLGLLSVRGKRRTSPKKSLVSAAAERQTPMLVPGTSRAPVLIRFNNGALLGSQVSPPRHPSDRHPGTVSIEKASWQRLSL